MSIMQNRKRPTVHDIAEAANVSLATVDRVLNMRPGVSSKSIDKVNAAIEQIGYSRNIAAAKLAKRNPYKFVFLLPARKNELIKEILETLRQTLQSSIGENIEVAVEHAPINKPNQFAKKISKIDPSEIDGLAVMAPESPELNEAIRQFQKRRRPVVTLFSDLPDTKTHRFIGINNASAGRTAAALLGRFLGNVTGSILIVTGSEDVKSLLERRQGFEEVISRDFPNLKVLPVVTGMDDPIRVEQLTIDALNTHSDIKGIYSNAGGNIGLANALKKMNLSDLPVIAHELTKQHRDALRDGIFDALVVQDLGHTIQSALRSLKASLDHSEVDVAQENIRIEIIIKENLTPNHNSHR